MTSRGSSLLPCLLVASLALAACGGSSESDDGPLVGDERPGGGRRRRSRRSRRRHRGGGVDHAPDSAGGSDHGGRRGGGRRRGGPGRPRVDRPVHDPSDAPRGVDGDRRHGGRASGRLQPRQRPGRRVQLVPRERGVAPSRSSCSSNRGRSRSPTAARSASVSAARSPGYPFVMTHINGWLVKLTGLSGEVSEEQLAAIGRLLEDRLIPRRRLDRRCCADRAERRRVGRGHVLGAGDRLGASEDEFTSGQDIGEAYAVVWVPDEEEAMADSMSPDRAVPPTSRSAVWRRRAERADHAVRRRRAARRHERDRPRQPGRLLLERRPGRQPRRRRDRPHDVRRDRHGRQHHLHR